MTVESGDLTLNKAKRVKVGTIYGIIGILNIQGVNYLATI